MQEIICYTHYLAEGQEKNISFFELFLDENWANGKIVCPEEVYCEVGDINHKLKAKQNYEFLLRAVRKYPFKAIGVSETDVYSAITPPISLWDDYCADCYIVGKYQQELLSSDYSESIMQTLAENALCLSDNKNALDFLEKMLSHSSEYYAIDDDTQPIMLLRGPNLCYGTLQFFIDQLAGAFRSCRQRVTVINDEENSFASLAPYLGHHFKAIIGVQTYAFSNIVSDAVTANLSNLIYGPKFNIILDHPIIIKDYIDYACNDYYLLIHDRNYLSFSKQYYHNVKEVFHFSPAGTPASSAKPIPKKYDITFIGSFRNYRDIFSIIHTLERPLRFLAARLIHIQRHMPDLTMEAAFQKALDYYNIHLDDASFLNLLYQLRNIGLCVIYYYREKVIQTLLDANIQVHVYSDSWKNAPFSEHPCLIRHPDIRMADGLSVMAQSKISLNLMSWHKDGLTERVLNGMLCRSAVLSDRSTRLEEEFIDGEDIILFDLTQIKTLPERIKKLLSDPDKLQKITENGYKKASEKHLWIHRAQQLLQIIHHLTDK